MKFFRPFMPVLSMLIISCGQNSNLKVEPGQQDIILTDPAKAEDLKKIESGIADTAGPLNEKVYNQATQVIDWNKRIIKTANIEAECSDYTMFNQKLHALVKQYGGWIASEAETQENGRINNSVSVKVPVVQFDEIISNLGNIGGKLLRKVITTEDVTSSVVDAEGRVAVKKAMRDKYLGMLKQSTKMEDVLNVQEKIDGIHEEIEMAATRAEFLKHESSYSTVNINFHPPVDAITLPDDSPGLGKRIISAAAGGFEWMADLLVGLTSIWPLLLTGFVIVYFIRRKIHHPIVAKKRE
jgi:hypothetical protein